MAATRLPLLLLLFSAALIHSLAAAQPVLDTSGTPLDSRSSYYILPVIRGRGGGLSSAARNASFCPLYVAQVGQEVLDGTAWRITPANPAATTIQLGADANIDFRGATICVQSTVWRMQSINPGGNLYVALTGSRGNPGAATLSSWFNIQRSGKDYKLVFCPGVCSTCRPQCGDLGVFVEEGKRWLGLGGSSFPVMFKKAVNV